MHQMVAVHGRRWMLVASGMDDYLAEDKRYVDMILKCALLRKECASYRQYYNFPQPRLACLVQGTSYRLEAPVGFIKYCLL